MKYLMKHKPVAVAIILAVLISFFFGAYRMNRVPLCVNADEASFGYNAWSLATTGKDEYGIPSPLRLKSFGDYKLPLLSYLSAPFVAVGGLDDSVIKLPNLILSAVFPIVIFAVVYELFLSGTIGVIAAALTAASLGLHLIGRQNHEALLMTFLLSVATYFFIRIVKKNGFLNQLLFFIFLVLALFTYHPARLFAVLFFLIGLVYTAAKKLNLSRFLLIFTIIFILFEITDLRYTPSRVKNLFIFADPGLALSINQLRGEGGSHLVYNKLTMGTVRAIHEYLGYYSPQFLVTNGDANTRFGYPGMSLITPIEFSGLFLGIYFLFKNKERWRYILTALLVAAPLSGALTWAGASWTRSFFMIVPVEILASYGLYHFLKQAKPVVIVGVLIIYGIFSFYSWDFYFNHYPKRATVIRSWECGYRELARYLQTQYQNYDRFYITRKNGQPYIFLLYYLKIPAGTYQKNARLTAPDEFGFGQVESFDKFTFEFRYPVPRKSVIVGFPDDFTDPVAKHTIDPAGIKKIRIGGEEMFWIYEVN